SPGSIVLQGIGVPGPPRRLYNPGLGGGSASGKTTVARMIIEALDVPWVVLLSMDSFYKVEVKRSTVQMYNLWGIMAFATRRCWRALEPSCRAPPVTRPSPAPGHEDLCGHGLTSLCGGCAENQRAGPGDIEGVIKRYKQFVKPALTSTSSPTCAWRTSWCPGERKHGGHRPHCAACAQPDGGGKLRWDMAALASAHQCHPLPRTLSVLKSTRRCGGMHTIIRLMRLLIEHAPLTSCLQDCVVVRPQQGTDYAGKCYAGKRSQVCVILREGEDHGTRAAGGVQGCATSVPFLIQTNQLTGEARGNFGDRYFGTDAVPDGSDEEEGGSRG
ncbi:Uridine-cytidine kinase-like 1, partial [Camelus dromedarius]